MSSEQARGVRQINQAIGGLDSMTQQNAALVEESAAAAGSPREQAEVLTQATSIFEIAGTQVPGRKAAPAVAGAPAAPKPAAAAAHPPVAPAAALRKKPMPAASAPKARAATPSSPVAPRLAKSTPAPVAEATAEGDWETL